MKYIILISLSVFFQTVISFAAQDTVADAGKSTAQKVQTIPAKASAGQTLQEEDILVDEAEAKKMPAPAVDTAGVKQVSVPSKNDSLAVGQKSTTGGDTVKTVAPVAEQKPDSAAVSPSKDSAAVTANKEPESARAPATVESVRSINFAKNLRDYRSPKLAMFLSLVVPGLGQAYVKRYYKTGIFVAIEATAIGFSIAFNNKGKQKNIDAKNFADNNYDYKKMISYYDGLQGFIKDLSQGENDPDSAARAKIYDIYMDSAFSSFKEAGKTKSQEFYKTIEANSYVQGWKDCQPPAEFTLNVNTDSIMYAGNYKYRKNENDTFKYLVSQIDSANVVKDSMLYGYSPKQKEFTDMMSKSNSFYKTAQNILFSMVINHILSAVDALISAKAYNDELIGKESVWRHISVEQQMVDAGSHSVHGCALKFRF